MVASFLLAKIDNKLNGNDFDRLKSMCVFSSTNDRKASIIVRFSPIRADHVYWARVPERYLD